MAQAKVITPEEQKRVLAVIAAGRHAERNRLLFLLTVESGMRVCEVKSLNVGHVLNLNINHVLMPGGIKDRVHFTKEQTKGKTSRTVYLSTSLQKELQVYVSSMSDTVLDNRVERPLFRTQKLTRFSSTTLIQLFREIFDKSGLPDCSSHSGRRTFITRLSTQGISVRVIQELVGHVSMQTTQKYIDVNEEQLINAIG